jgi:hypothetical protein
MTLPDWLSRRDGTLVPAISPSSLFVAIGGQPHYRLDARPAKNQFTCTVTQTANGKSLNVKDGYPTRDAALTGGLEQLRTAMGW